MGTRWSLHSQRGHNGSNLRNALRRAGIDFNVSPHWMQHAHGSHALDRGTLEMQNSQKAGAKRRILFMYTRNVARQEAGATSLPRAAAKYRQLHHLVPEGGSAAAKRMCRLACTPGADIGTESVDFRAVSHSFTKSRGSGRH
jgi:hypothetical protein